MRTAAWAPTVVGAAWWLLVIGVGGVAGRISLIHAMLLLAIAVIVPMAVPLHPVVARWSPWWFVVAGVPVGPAIMAEPGLAAAVLCLPWLAIAVVVALRALVWWTRQSDWFSVIAWPAAAGYLAVGAAWTLADRLALEPAGVGPPFVALTAVHFHYAGFVAALIVGCARRWLTDSPAVIVAVVATVVAPPIVAIGFTVLAAMQIAGAVLLTVGLLMLSWLTLRQIAPTAGGTAGALLAVSAVAVLVPMLLATQWAVGTNLGTPALSIAAMSRWHGVTNAVGFSLCGVLGWRLLAARHL